VSKGALLNFGPMGHSIRSSPLMRGQISIFHSLAQFTFLFLVSSSDTLLKQ
jgi:hypothetical protein